MKSRSAFTRRHLAGAHVLALAIAGCAGHGSFSMLGIDTPTADRDADVYVDGEYIGQVDQVSGQLRLAPGLHRVEVRKPGRFPVQQTVRVERRSPTSETTVVVDLLSDPR